MSAPNIVLKGASRKWGSRVALQELSLTVKPGERIALVGPSGSGKTTLLRLLMATLKTSAGTVSVDDKVIGAMTPREIRDHRLRCALVDQGSQILPKLTVHANVIAGCVAKWPWWRILASTLIALDKEKVAALLDNVGLADRQWDQADELSGGQRQRVSIARALAGDAQLLLADEPTAALDPTTSADVIELMGRVTKERKATLIISTHRVSQVINTVDRLIGLRDGTIFFDQPSATTTDDELTALYKGSRERA